MSRSPEALKDEIFAYIDACRRDLKEEGRADLSGVESGVRAYCEALTAEPSASANEDLRALAKAVEELNAELKHAHAAVWGELEALERLRIASAAYRRSTAMSNRHIKGKPS